MYAIGQLISAIDLQVVNVTEPTQYRRAIYSEWVLNGLWMICFIFLPESPWYYARKDRPEPAKKVLRRIYKGIDDFDPEREYITMLRTIEHERAVAQSRSTWAEIFRGPNLWRTIASCTGLDTLHWAGTSVLFIYSTCT